MSYNDKKVWFVTGASSGLGRAVVEYVLEKEDRVVATLRKPSALADLVIKCPEDQLLVFKLDVIAPADITSAFSAALAKFGRVDIVYNNAGCLFIAEVEGTPHSDARRMFEVNFWGATNVTREAIRVFRDVNTPPGGHLLQASSVAAIQAVPGGGYYSASKFALEGGTQALAEELHPLWNIKITILELGYFRTPILDTQENLHVVPAHPAYVGADLSSAATWDVLESGKAMEKSGDANKAAREIYNVALDECAGLRVPLGLDAMAAAERHLDELQRDAEAAGKWNTVDLK